MVEKAFAWLCRVIVTLRKDYFRELPRFNRKRLEKCFIEKRKPYQTKPVAFKTVDPDRRRPYCI